MTSYEVLKRCEAIKKELVAQFPAIEKTYFEINNRLRGCVGRAKQYGKFGLPRVQIAGFYYVYTDRNDQFLENTIRHELAHIAAYAVNPLEKHGSLWRHIATQMGCDGKECTDNVRALDEIKFNCTACGKEWEAREQLLRKWEREGRTMKCKCKNRLPYPWQPKTLAPSMPKRMIVQRSVFGA